MTILTIKIQFEYNSLTSLDSKAVEKIFGVAHEQIQFINVTFVGDKSLKIYKAGQIKVTAEVYVNQESTFEFYYFYHYPKTLHEKYLLTRKGFILGSSYNDYSQQILDYENLPNKEKGCLFYAFDSVWIDRKYRNFMSIKPFENLQNYWRSNDIVIPETTNIEYFFISELSNIFLGKKYLLKNQNPAKLKNSTKLMIENLTTIIKCH